MPVLQSLLLPNLDVCNEEALYLRPNERAWTELGKGCVHCDVGGTVSTDTFYNGLTVAAWKERCQLRTLSFELRGSGRFVVTVGHHAHGRASAWLQEDVLDLQPDRAQQVPIRNWDRLRDGMLYLHLRALSAGELHAATWLTADVPVRDVHLGIVITHFNRVQQVIPAVRRIVRFITSRADLQARVTLTVVDNSQNLPLQSHGVLTVLPNRNLGGTGGFVRGLLELIDGGRHTHALFMDDDASCEVDAIGRCLALLQHARESDCAVAGALLRETMPWHLVEKGARFDGEVRPIASGLDVRRVDHLLDAERPLVRPDYGAWWFFAFPLAAVRAFPFPFFVRGDDIFFGLQNRFQIVTMNGIACYGEDFSLKHGPLNAYLDARYHLVLALAGERNPLARLLWIGRRLFLKQLTSYHYSSAHAVTLALRHTLKGPRFFERHLDLQAVRREIASWTPDERLRPLDRSEHTVRNARRDAESWWRRLARALTLQGFLLPDVLLLDRMTVQDKAFHGSARAVFRYRRVLYQHAPSGTGYIAHYDRGRFFSELGHFVVVFGRLVRRLPALRKAYAAGVRRLTSLAFWRTVYVTTSAANDTGWHDDEVAVEEHSPLSSV
jgi:galactofuranosylgalactofuranosylrhamnosyl-N-acetylglucosaminyl-diphospho-decaprenol beta-1,5/1,6-galactofuranosyltransferase